MLKKKPKPTPKQELWEKDLSAYRRFKINANVKWRRFDTQTRGMGLILVILLGGLLLVTCIPFVTNYINQELDKGKYNTALNIACKDLQFYALNFRSCENSDVRPDEMSATN